MAERPIGANTRKKLINNEPFAYAHLVKFERPSSSIQSGKSSTDAKRYAYFTDAAHNLSFDDQSYNTLGTSSNGTQTYIAGKLIQVGSYSETIEARASGMTITLAAESLNNAITSSTITMTSSTITVPAGIDLVKEGFREGDKIFISGGTNNNKYVNVTGIKTNNTVLVVANIDHTLATQNTGTAITLSIVSDELQGPLGETNLSTIKSYANRDVWVYKAFLNPETGEILDNTPVLIFKGIITKADITESPGSSVKAKWSLTSHWGDFAQVTGRATNDSTHRALDNNNRGQVDSALRPEYANDLGFLHAEETINVLATYTTIETETEYRNHKSWLGARNKTKSYTVDTEISNVVKLDFALSSKFLPVVYGVQRVDALPFFVDTKEDDANNIFIAYALCEGEIGGIYDLYIENNPLMCINKEDAVSRDSSGGGDTTQVEVHCRGRADRGNTLGGVKTSGNGVTGSNAANYAYGNPYTGYSESGFEFEEDYITADLPRYRGNNKSLRNTSLATTDGTGVQHGETISLTAPNIMSLTLHTGKSDQLADNQLVEIASASSGSKFKRQADYYTGDEDYWGPNHRVLDTAYVVMDCEIGEDATTVPEIEYVVRGKLCSSYNYDYSYAHTPTISGEDHTDFKVGDKVVLHNSTGNGVLNSSVQIIDKWSFADPDGTIQYRFRFSSAPALGYSDGYATIKQFYMKNSSNETWTMSTWDWQLVTSGTVPELLDETVTINNNGSSAATITVPSNTDWIQDVAGDPDFPDYHGIKIANSTYAYGYKTLWFTQTNTTTLTHAGTGNTSVGLTAGSHTIISATGIKLASNSSATDDYYNGYEIELTKSTTGADGTVQIATHIRRIVDYDGGTKIATINAPWLPQTEPTANDTYTLNGKSSAGRTDDKRVSINPAIQLTDYLTGVYGKNLDLEKDIALSDFLLAARTCDDRGTQTLQGTDVGSGNVGNRYVLTSDGTTSGSVVTMGLVKSRGTSNSIGYTEFQEVSSKFTHKFMDSSYSYSIGDIVYTGEGYYRAGSAGIETKKPAGTSNISAGSNSYVLSWTYLTSISLFAISDAGVISGSAVNFTRSANSVYYNPCATYNSTLETYETGYSLYDSDHVKFWRYYGWDDQHQRFATRHQTQGTVSTSDSVFANVNGFLQQFNGLLSYEGGKYALRIETTSDAITSTIINASNTGSYSGYTKGVQHNPRIITDDDIIGNLSIKDKGTSKSFNTVSASIMDPANLFKGRSVSFYDSNYLKADKNVVKSGNISISSIGNYYNARINVENFLRKSRFGLSISFKTGPKALMLLAGDTIAITNQKFAFTEKKFRITNISYSQDCTANITAEEYDDSFYTISAPTLSSVKSDDQRLGLQASPPVPNSLANPTVGALGELTLNWVNGTGLTPNCFTEIWSHPTNSAANRTLLTRVAGQASTFAHTLGGKDVTRYYWIRSGKAVTLSSGAQNKTKELFSAYVGPVNATTTAPISAYGIVLGGPTSFVVDTDGASTPTTLNITAARTNLGGNITWSAVEEDGGSITLTSTSNTNATLTYANFGASNKYVTVTATVTSTNLERAAGAQNTYISTWVVSKVASGSEGADAKTVKLTVPDYSIVYAADGGTPQPSGNMDLTATTQNFDNAYFKFTGDGITDEGSYSDGSGANADTFVFAIPSSHFATPKSLKVSVQEGSSGGEAAFDTISIFGVKPGATGPAGIDGMTFVSTNDSHVFPASATGAVSSYAGSGTTFEVYEGGTELVYDGTGTANSKWKVVVTTDTNITASSSFTDNGNSVTVGNHSGVGNGTDLSSIIYTISGKRADGTTFSITKQQSFAKSKLGAAGAAGLNTATVALYNKNTSTSSAPTSFSGTFTYTFATGAISGGTLNGWTTAVPALAAGEYAWVRQATASANVSTDNSIPTSEFSTAVMHSGIGEDGESITGAAGNSNALIALYRVSTDGSSAPAAFSGTFTYTYATGAVSGGTLNSWTATIPTVPQGSYLWVRQATASSNTSTDTIATSEFSEAAVMSASGSNGAAGLNTATVTLYRKSTSNSSAPSAFSGTFTFTFATGAVSGGTLNSWTTALPSITNGEYIWQRQSTASSSSSTDSIPTSEFSGAVVHSGVGSDGSSITGAAGNSNALVALYRVSTSSSSAPAAFSGTFTYTFSSGAVTGGTLNSWTATVPTVAQGSYLWARQATASSNTGSDTIAHTEFSTAVVMGASGADGAPGAAGANSATVTLYRKSTSNSSAPAAFSGTFTYTFATGIVTNGTLNSWTTALPSITNGEYIWQRQATASNTATTDSIPTSEFSAAVVHSGVGANGQSITGAAGNSNALVALYRVHTSNSSAPSAFSGTFTFTFATGAVTGGTLNSWTAAAPNVPDGSYLWVRQATASASATTDTIATSEFSTAVVIGGVGEDGDQGAQGDAGAQGDTGDTGAAGATGAAGITVSNSMPLMFWASGDNGSTYTPNSTHTAQITFKQGSTTIAACRILGTINVNNGNITLSEVSGQTSGSPSIAYVNNGSTFAQANITKTDVVTTVSGQATNMGNLGK